MAPRTGASDNEDHIEYLLNLILTAEDFKPDFQALAAKCGINTAQNAQRRYKAIAEKSGKFELKKSILSEKLAATTAPPADPAQIGSTGSATAAGLSSATPSTSPTKTTKSNKRAAPASAKKTSKRVKTEDDAEHNDDVAAAGEDNGGED